MASTLFIGTLIALLGLRVWAGLRFTEWLKDNPGYASKIRHQYY